MNFDLSEIKLSESDMDKKIILPEEMTEDLAEEIGLHVGDGSMNVYSNKRLFKGLFQLRGHIIDDREHYQIRIKELYKKLYNLNIHIRDMKSTGVIGFQVWSDAIVDFKNKLLELPLGKKENMELPKTINDKALFFSFMRGLFDTDGTVYIENKRGKPYPRVEIKTTFKPLSLQLLTLLNEYGVRATHYEYKRKEANWNNLYTISVRGFPAVNAWLRSIGSNNPKHIKKFKLVESSGLIYGPGAI